MRRLWFSLLCACAIHITASAHVLDQYLQVAQIAIEPDSVRVDLRLTPGVQVADRIFALIDVDHDGQISNAEEQDYVQRVLHDIALEVDGRRTPLTLTRVQFPSRGELNDGVGAIRLALEAQASFGAAGSHQIAFRNDHQPEFGAYLANALVPKTESIKITGQERDELQHVVKIDFQSTPDAVRGWPRWPGILIICLGLALLLSQINRLRHFYGAGRSEPEIKFVRR